MTLTTLSVNCKTLRMSIFWQKNTERPLTLQMKGNLVFIDRLNFLSGSLDHFASKLPLDDLDEYLCWLTRRDASRMRLLLHKAALPYDFIDSLDKLNVTKLLPIDAFYNKTHRYGIISRRLPQSPENLARIRLQHIKRLHGSIRNARCASVSGSVRTIESQPSNTFNSIRLIT